MELSSSEVNLLRKLKTRIEDLKLLPDELENKNLVRWLRARKYNLDATELMIRKHREWYMENNIKEIVNFKAPLEWTNGEEFPWYVVGFDDYGCPVTVNDVGHWDVAKAMAAGKKAEFSRFFIQLLQSLLTLCSKQSEGQPYMAQFIALYDFKGLSFRQVTSYDVLETALSLVKIFEANFPETLKKAFMLNAPRAFHILWKLLKPVIDEGTHSKIVFIGSDFNCWTKEISKIVPLDQFPQKYGGTAHNSTKFVIENDGTYRKV